MEIYSSYVMQLLLKLTILLPRPYLTLDDFDALFRTFGYQIDREFLISWLPIIIFWAYPSLFQKHVMSTKLSIYVFIFGI